mgnify:CR=1 FL=1
MIDPRHRIYRRILKFNEAANKLQEISYQGNIGLHELAKFYQIASKRQVDVFEKLLAMDTPDSQRKAWNLIQAVTKTRLQGLTL